MKKILKQINAAAPVRVCDIGGWTDTWFAGHGAVFNIAVTPCVEVEITTYPQDSDQRVNLNLCNYNESYSLDPRKIIYNKHPLIEAVIAGMEIPSEISLDIHIASEVPAGASVGTSAAVCIALTAALDALTPGRLTAHEIADLSHKVETEKLGLQSGIQDQLCCAYGGINYIDMHRFPFSTVTPLKIKKQVHKELGNRLSLIYIGTPHNSSEVHKMVIADLGKNPSTDPRLERLRQLAKNASDAVVAGDLKGLAGIMNANTEVQRALHPALVCEKFAELIDIAEDFGVHGCKVNGAGGDGGSITILSAGDVSNKPAMLGTMESKGFHILPITLANTGVRVGPATQGRVTPPRRVG
ncbi:MAG: GHMP kinase [bacterium]|nr:GHMP kinase [bacterium]